MAIFWLDKRLIFPPVERADPNGILAVGGDLSTERLLLAYRSGIFPWFSPDDPMLWWSPDPRFVLFPDELKMARSMRPYFNSPRFELSVDTAFGEVISACSRQYRTGQNGTWITDEMIAAYCELHRLGHAHSVEVWQDGQLVGGLYGIAIGRVFFGESMFANVPNASKVGFIALVKRLQKLGFQMIDCQQDTAHLASLGARGIPRQQFIIALGRWTREHNLIGNWSQMEVFQNLYDLT
jgi:leucyl/phenylalanyl-tRNA--protein transferase